MGRRSYTQQWAHVHGYPPRRTGPSIAGGRASAAKASTDGVWASRPMTSAATRMRFVTSAIWAAMCESSRGCAGGGGGQWTAAALIAHVAGKHPNPPKDVEHMLSKCLESGGRFWPKLPPPRPKLHWWSTESAGCVLIGEAFEKSERAGAHVAHTSSRWIVCATEGSDSEGGLKKRRRRGGLKFGLQEASWPLSTHLLPPSPRRASKPCLET